MSFFLIRHSSSSLFLSSSQRMFARWTSQKWFFSIKTDYYKILGVSNNSTQEQIKKEFHKLAKLHHPDSAENQGDNEKFKEISEAYNVLGDADKRVKYDSDLNLEKQRQASQQQHHQNHTHGFTQSGSHSSHNNHFHKHHEFRRRHQQHDENSERFRTARSSHSDGFDEKEDFGEKQSIWDNLKTVPELWLIAGLFGMLVMRWIYLVHSPNQRGKITMDPFDDDFEVSSEERKNKKIELKPEDVYGMSLAVLDQIYSTGKYELPPKVKANVEEYRNLKGKGNKNDGQQQQYQGGNQVELGNIPEIQTENKQQKKVKKEEAGNDNIQAIQQVKPVEKTDSIETPKKSRGFNYAQRFNQKDKTATTIPEKSDSQVTSSDSNELNQIVIIKEFQENKDQAVIDQQKIEQQRKQRQYERQKIREKVEEDQKKGWLPVNRESSIPAFINVGSSQTEEKLNKNIEQQDENKQENEKV